MAKMTACDPWTVKHLLARLTDLGNQSFPNFALGMLKNRGNFHKFTDSDLQKYLKGSAADMIAGFEKALEHSKPSPGPKYVKLSEYTVHGEDIAGLSVCAASIRLSGSNRSPACMPRQATQSAAKLAPKV
ncbi:MAG: hypothetical protein ACKVHU_19780 [Acidimicrobiales bacterium]|jgi:hypothetical protein